MYLVCLIVSTCLLTRGLVTVVATGHYESGFSVSSPCFCILASELLCFLRDLELWSVCWRKLVFLVPDIGRTVVRII